MDLGGLGDGGLEVWKVAKGGLFIPKFQGSIAAGLGRGTDKPKNTPLQAWSLAPTHPTDNACVIVCANPSGSEHPHSTPKHSMGLEYMPTLTPQTTPSDRHIWQSRGVSGT